MKTAILLLMALSAPIALAQGGNGGGGGAGMGGHGGTNGTDQEVQAYRDLLPELQADTLAYVKEARRRNLPAFYVEGSPLLVFRFSTLEQDVAGSSDIYVEGSCAETERAEEAAQTSCRASELANRHEWVACAYYGERGGKITLDLQRLGKLYGNLSREQKLVKLRSIVLHEHYHHLVGNPAMTCDERAAHEREATVVGAFVLNDPGAPKRQLWHERVGPEQI